LLSAFLAASGCGGAGFEPPSKIQGLRVLALQKEPAYARPEETVQLKMLYWDGKVSEGSSRNLAFNFFQCDDPPGDLYYSCWDRLKPVLGGAPPTMGDASVGDDAEAGADAGMSSTPMDAGPPGEEAPVVTLSVTIPPKDAIIRPKIPIDYGLRYIFFTACAGHLGLIDPSANNGLPFGCLDDQNRKLGPDDFVPGYSAIYVYDELRNTNPVVDAVLKTSFPDDLHIARCTQGDRGNCPSFDVQPVIDIEASAEDDPVGRDPNGPKLKEQLWVAYMSTAGDFTKDLRLVNDATTGPNLDYGTKFRAPATAGPVHIFGIVHDNRGGVAWAQKRVVVD
jgi:hypothetical protein